MKKKNQSKPIRLFVDVDIKKWIESHCQNDLFKLEYNHPEAGYEWDVKYTGNKCFGEYRTIKSNVDGEIYDYCCKCYRIVV